MTIALFGGTGKTGSLFLFSALEQGHTVRVLARNPQKLSLEHQNLQVIEGDARNLDVVDRVVEGSDIVVSFLGVNPKSGEFVFTHSLEALFSSMKKFQISRIILTAGAGVGDPKDKKSLMGSLVTGIIKLIARNAYEDGLKAGALVRSQSNLDWTMVRIPRLTDDTGDGKNSTVRVGYLGVGTGFSLRREDLARFVLENMTNSGFTHQAPVISN